LKFLSDEKIQKIVERVSAKPGDLIFFGAGGFKFVNLSMNALMTKLAQDFGLLKEGLHFVWIKDFPMFEMTDGGLSSVHHPFTAPIETDDLENTKAVAYDLVLNGYELGGGSIRISDSKLQRKVFERLGLDDIKIEKEFGHLLNALEQGCPYHGGIAFGIDRMTMVLLGINSMRDVIAFPKTQTASCALTKAPGEVLPSQWRELGLKVTKGEEDGRA
jgi:aspartyl-tRNA synthetase